jgi:hypothetical protein
LSWEIGNFSERKNPMASRQFSSGGCKWYVTVDPEGFLGCDHLTLFLCVGDRNSLKIGWKRRAMYCFFLLNQSGENLYSSSGQIRTFCNEASGWGVQTTVPLTKLREKGFLKKNKLTVQVFMKVAEVVHQGKPTANDMLDFGRFQITASQACRFAETIEQHPDFAVDVIGKNQELKTAHKDLLLGLIETLSKSPQNLSVAELSSARSQFTELTEAGFKLDWLKPKLKEDSLERKEALPDGSSVQELEERLKKMELTLCDLEAKLEEHEKIKSAAAARVYSFEFLDFFITRIFLSCFSISKH